MMISVHPLLRFHLRGDQVEYQDMMNLRRGRPHFVQEVSQGSRQGASDHQRSITQRQPFKLDFGFKPRTDENMNALESGQNRG